MGLGRVLGRFWNDFGRVLGGFGPFRESQGREATMIRATRKERREKREEKREKRKEKREKKREKMEEE